MVGANRAFFFHLTCGNFVSCRESKLANQCFKEAQDQDPSYIKAWVGQALLAEQTKFKHHEEEAMDLFRHTTLLGNELESAVGYANWVCR